MKKIPRWFKSIYSPRELQNLDAAELLEAIGSATIAKQWLYEIYNDLKLMNLEIDQAMVSGRDLNLTALCARRRAYQDVLESIKRAKKAVSQAPSHNPRPQAHDIDLDRVTV